MSPLDTLKNEIKTRFNLEEIRSLCFSLSLNYDELPGNHLSRKAESLLLAVYQLKKTELFADVLLKERPDSNWRSLLNAISNEDWQSLLEEAKLAPNWTASISTSGDKNKIIAGKNNFQLGAGAVNISHAQTRSDIEIQTGGSRTTIETQINIRPFGKFIKGNYIEVISLKSILAILVITLMIGGFSLSVWQYLNRPPNLQGEFNIAIADFGEFNSQGEIVSSVSGQRISQALLLFLQSEFESQPFGLEVVVSNNNMPLITEDTKASELLKETNAHIVIYGTVAIDGQNAEFIPSFYVGENSNISEISGPNELAVPIEFEKQDLGFQSKVNKKLQEQSSILVLVTKGLVHLENDDILQASSAFEEAIRRSDSLLIPDFDGKELLFLLRGLVARLDGDIDGARIHYENALSTNPEYARAYIGMGNTFYQEFQIDWENKSLLDDSISFYEKALTAKDKPAGSFIDPKVYYSLGTFTV